jgi:hypothetical protein
MHFSRFLHYPFSISLHSLHALHAFSARLHFSFRLLRRPPDTQPQRPRPAQRRTVRGYRPESGVSKRHPKNSKTPRGVPPSVRSKAIQWDKAKDPGEGFSRPPFSWAYDGAALKNCTLLRGCTNNHTVPQGGCQPLKKCSTRHTSWASLIPRQVAQKTPKKAYPANSQIASVFNRKIDLLVKILWCGLSKCRQS